VLRTRAIEDAEPAQAHGRQRSSPLVRRIAQEQGVDITTIDGTGIHNRVTKNDILSYIENRPAAAASGTDPTRPFCRSAIPTGHTSV